MTRALNVYEPEDNIASLMEMMGGHDRGSLWRACYVE